MILLVVDFLVPQIRDGRCFYLLCTLHVLHRKLKFSTKGGQTWGSVCVCVCGEGGGEFAGGLLPQKIFKFILGSRKCDFQRSAGHYSKSIRRKLQ